MKTNEIKTEANKNVYFTTFNSPTNKMPSLCWKDSSPIRQYWRHFNYISLSLVWQLVLLLFIFHPSNEVKWTLNLLQWNFYVTFFLISRSFAFIDIHFKMPFWFLWTLPLSRSTLEMYFFKFLWPKQYLYCSCYLCELFTDFYLRINCILKRFEVQ